MIDSVDWLTWDLIHNWTNALLGRMLVESSSSSKSSSNPPAIVLVTPTSTELILAQIFFFFRSLLSSITQTVDDRRSQWLGSTQVDAAVLYWVVKNLDLLSPIAVVSVLGVTEGIEKSTTVDFRDIHLIIQAGGRMVDDT
jgi:hypothetical protein